MSYTKEFDSTNRGRLFRNDRKTEEKHSDYSGEINIDGHEFWLNGWIKEGKKGKYMSLSIKPKGQAHKEGIAKVKSDNWGDDPKGGDDIPF